MVNRNQSTTCQRTAPAQNAQARAEHSSQAAANVKGDNGHGEGKTLFF